MLRTARNVPSSAGTLRQLSSRAASETLGIRVHPSLKKFVDDRLLPGTDVAAREFWDGLDSIVRDFGPLNKSLLRKRDEIQAKIDEWHHSPTNESQASFLRKIGYLEEKPRAVSIQTEGVDAEIASIAGPQLVCPVDNGRFVLNAANARWGSLLDAFYGTDAVLPAVGGGGGYDEARGAAVYDEVHKLLDEVCPLTVGGWGDVSAVDVDGSLLRLSLGESAPQAEARLLDGAQFVGYSRPEAAEAGGGALSVLLVRHGLHLELVIDPARAAGRHAAGLVDVRIESALSTICDMEDSACTVDAEDKVGAYSNWLGLMDRTLAAAVDKGGRRVERTLHPAREWSAADGRGKVTLPGQSLLLARNVGMHMLSDMVTTADGEPVPEHFVDALVTAAAALHDVRGHAANSRTGAVYIVKPKMHGPEEAALASALFSRVEDILRLPRHTIKMGVMDEERRTSANLGATMAAVGERLFFVNTGFLDRTADEIHTAMEAGAMLPKAAIKAAGWYGAYEVNNVQTSLAAALVGRGQIGKGMWAEPDNMGAMMAQKGAQIEAGASTAWVPSPIAATLHALHYLRRSVAEVQSELTTAQTPSQRELAAERTLDALLTPPLLSDAPLSPTEVQAELDNNAQGLLGYVVRWVGQGVGCSKVPDLHDVQLMEDRATLRISSQHIANWLRHGVVSEEQVMSTLKRVAHIVDAQNVGDPSYKAMTPAFDSPEWHAALELVFSGTSAPNGYTEATLSRWRRERKAIEQLSTDEAQSPPVVAVYRRRSSLGGAQ